MTIAKNSLMIAFGVSVALNLLILGSIGGIAVAGLRHEASPPLATVKNWPSHSRFNPKQFIHALPEMERRKALHVMKGVTENHRKIRRAIRKTRSELGDLLAAETLDEDKIQSTYDHLRTLKTDEQKLGQSIMLDIVRELDPQTRRRAIRAANRHSDHSRRHQSGENREGQDPHH